MALPLIELRILICSSFMLLSAGVAPASVLAADNSAVNEKVLLSLDGATGYFPQAALTKGRRGFSYGTASFGGANGKGTVFRVSPTGNVKVIYSFTGGADGAYPGQLVLGSDGAYYGITTGGGAAGFGTVFKISGSGHIQPLHSFSGGHDGADPFAGAALVEDGNGNFYGTTSQDGNFCSTSSSCGTVFKITRSGVITTLYEFTGGADGTGPFTGLTWGLDGDLYGTTPGVFMGPGGTVFSITTAGVLTTLYTFGSGAAPNTTLALGNDGNFYGTTNSGGIGVGTVYQITPAGKFTALYSFTGGADGAIPSGALILGSDGNFYGTTEVGGIGCSQTEGCGTVYRITFDGTLTTLHAFGGGSTDGGWPYKGLVESRKGVFLGTTTQGGIYDDGVIYQIIPH